MAESGREHAKPGNAGHDSAASDAHGEKGGASDPMHHIKDKVLLGLGADGRIYTKPYGDHGHLVYESYAPRVMGPVKLEFTKHMAGVTVVALILAVVVVGVARKVMKNVGRDEPTRGPLANIVEALLVFVRDDLVIPSGGQHAAPYTPLFLTYFFFILSCNLAGLIPDFGGTTGNIAVTAFLGGSVWVILTFLGMVKQGPVKYFLHMVPPGTPWWMWPLMLFLEFIGPLIKCFVLCVRLFANMIAGHLVVSNVLALGVIGKGAMMPLGLAILSLVIGVPLALGITALEILVCFIQAYVFTMLAIIFVGAAIHPEH